jgi:hypothetical protein
MRPSRSSATSGNSRAYTPAIIGDCVVTGNITSSDALGNYFFAGVWNDFAYFANAAGWLVWYNNNVPVWGISKTLGGIISPGGWYNFTGYADEMNPGAGATGIALLNPRPKDFYVSGNITPAIAKGGYTFAGFWTGNPYYTNAAGWLVWYNNNVPVWGISKTLGGIISPGGWYNFTGYADEMNPGAGTTGNALATPT